MNIPGFAPYTPRVRKHPSIITCSHGLEKRGKSNFALTAPSPHAYIDMDEGLDELARKFPDKELYRCTVTRPDTKSQDDNARAWKQLEDSYNKALKVPGLRSLTVDTGTDAWEWMRLAKFGKLAQVPPLKYVEINSEFINLVRSANDYDINVTWIHRVKKEYTRSNDGKDAWSGRYERAGFNDWAFLAHLVIEHDRVTERDEAGQPTTQFIIRILDCKQNPDIIGMELVGSDLCNFQTVASMVYPENDPDVWE